MKMKRIQRVVLLSLSLAATALFSMGCYLMENSEASASSSASESASNAESLYSTSTESETYSISEWSSTVIEISSQSGEEISTGYSSENVEGSSSDGTSSEETSSEEESSLISSSSEEKESNSSEELPHVHVYRSQLLRAPDCENEGILRYACECGHFYTETPAALGHVAVIDERVASTCIKKGLSEGSHCSRCEEVLVAQEELSLVHHTYEKGYCTVCNLTGLTFSINRDFGYAVCTGYTCDLGTVRRVVIPDTYCGYPVRELAPSLFENCRDLYSVEIGKNVESIGEGAFHGCYHLVEIYDRSEKRVSEYDKSKNGSLRIYAEDDDVHYETFESEIEIIDDFVVFHDDGESFLLTYLGTKKSIAIPNGVTWLVMFSLQEYDIVEVTVPASVRYIERWSFYLCEKLERVYFLDPDNWEARGHDHTDCPEDKLDLMVDNIKDWTPFGPGELDTPEKGKTAVIDYFNYADWRKVQAIEEE